MSRPSERDELPGSKLPWLVNPERYDEPPFHRPGLNSLDVPVEDGEALLSRGELLDYFGAIRGKVFPYLESLTDEMLAEKSEACAYSRMALILGQYRHLYAHLGNIQLYDYHRERKMAAGCRVGRRTYG
jgi:hypothetical protein